LKKAHFDLYYYCRCL